MEFYCISDGVANPRTRLGDRVIGKAEGRRQHQRLIHRRHPFPTKRIDAPGRVDGSHSITIAITRGRHRFPLSGCGAKAFG